MESNERYYARRAVEELRALERAVTPEARARRLALAESFQLKARQCGGQIGGGQMGGREMGGRETVHAAAFPLRT